MVESILARHFFSWDKIPPLKINLKPQIPYDIRK
jgi:hypothetical protein